MLILLIVLILNVYRLG